MQKVEDSNPFSRFAGTRSRSGFRASVCLSRPALAEQFASRVRSGSGYLAPMANHPLTKKRGLTRAFLEWS
jgi:hypothetical protein